MPNMAKHLSNVNKDVMFLHQFDGFACEKKLGNKPVPKPVLFGHRRAVFRVTAISPKRVHIFDPVAKRSFKRCVVCVLQDTRTII